MYNKIVNPFSGKKVSIFSKTGKNILKNYLRLVSVRGDVQTGGFKCHFNCRKFREKCERSALGTQCNENMDQKHLKLMNDLLKQTYHKEKLDDPNNPINKLYKNGCDNTVDEKNKEVCSILKKYDLTLDSECQPPTQTGGAAFASAAALRNARTNNTPKKPLVNRRSGESDGRPSQSNLDFQKQQEEDFNKARREREAEEQKLNSFPSCVKRDFTRIISRLNNIKNKMQCYNTDDEGFNKGTKNPPLDKEAIKNLTPTTNVVSTSKKYGVCYTHDW